VGQLCWTAVNAVVPEMYDKDKLSVYSSMESAFRSLTTAATAVSQRAVSSSEFTALIGKIEAELHRWIAESLRLDFTEEFAAASLVVEIAPSASLIARVAKLSAGLAGAPDQGPDPENAGKIGGKLDLPPLSDVSPPFPIALGAVTAAEPALQAAVVSLAQAAVDELVPGDSVVSAYKSFETAALNYIGLSMAVAVAAPDSKLRADQITMLPGFTDLLNAVREAIKARILRRAGFQDQVRNSIVTFQGAIQGVLGGLGQGWGPEFLAISQYLDDNVERQLTIGGALATEVLAGLKRLQGSESWFMQLAVVLLEGSVVFFAKAKALVAKSGGVDNSPLVVQYANEFGEALECLLLAGEALAEKVADAEFRAFTAAALVKQSLGSLAQYLMAKGVDEDLVKVVTGIAGIADQILQKAEEIGKGKATAEIEDVGKLPTKLMKKLKLTAHVEKETEDLKVAEKDFYGFDRRF
jgi:hypothetical protein